MSEPGAFKPRKFETIQWPGPEERLLALAIVAHAVHPEAVFTCYESLRTISNTTGLKIPRIRYLLKILEAMDVLQVVTPGHQPIICIWVRL